MQARVAGRTLASVTTLVSVVTTHATVETRRPGTLVLVDTLHTSHPEPGRATTVGHTTMLQYYTTMSTAGRRAPHIGGNE